MKRLVFKIRILNLLFKVNFSNRNTFNIPVKVYLMVIALGWGSQGHGFNLQAIFGPGLSQKIQLD